MNLQGMTKPPGRKTVGTRRRAGPCNKEEGPEVHRMQAASLRVVQDEHELKQNLSMQSPVWVIFCNYSTVSRLICCLFTTHKGAKRPRTNV